MKGETRIRGMLILQLALLRIPFDAHTPIKMICSPILFTDS